MVSSFAPTLIDPIDQEADVLIIRMIRVLTRAEKMLEERGKIDAQLLAAMTAAADAQRAGAALILKLQSDLAAIRAQVDEMMDDGGRRGPARRPVRRLSPR